MDAHCKIFVTTIISTLMSGGVVAGNETKRYYNPYYHQILNDQNPSTSETHFTHTYQKRTQGKSGAFDPNTWGFKVYNPNEGMDNYLGIVTNTDLMGPLPDKTHSQQDSGPSATKPSENVFNPDSLNAYLMSFVKPEENFASGSGTFSNMMQIFSPSTFNGQMAQVMKYDPGLINLQLIPEPSFVQQFTAQGMPPNPFSPSGINTYNNVEMSITHAPETASNTIATTQEPNAGQGDVSTNNETENNIDEMNGTHAMDNQNANEVHPTNDVIVQNLQVTQQEGQNEQEKQKGKETHNVIFPVVTDGQVSIDPQTGKVTGFDNTHPVHQVGGKGYTNMAMMNEVSINGTVHATGIGGLGMMDNVATGYVKYENQIGPEVPESANQLGTGNFTSGNVIATGIGSLGLSGVGTHAHNLGLPVYNPSQGSGPETLTNGAFANGVGSFGTSTGGVAQTVKNNTNIQPGSTETQTLTQHSVNYGNPVKAFGIGSLDGKTGNGFNFTGTNYAHVTNIGSNFSQTVITGLTGAIPEASGIGSLGFKVPTSNQGQQLMQQTAKEMNSENAEFLKELLGEDIYKQLNFPRQNTPRAD